MKKIISIISLLYFFSCSENYSLSSEDKETIKISKGIQQIEKQQLEMSIKLSTSNLEQAKYFIKKQKLNKALSFVNESIKIYTKNREAYLIKFQILQIQNKKTECLEILDRIIYLFPSSRGRAFFEKANIQENLDKSFCISLKKSCKLGYNKACIDLKNKCP